MLIIVKRLLILSPCKVSLDQIALFPASFVYFFSKPLNSTPPLSSLYSLIFYSLQLSPTDHDAEDVVSWVLGQPSRFDLSKVSLGGHSAGGNLAIATSSVFNPKINSVVCAYPRVDFVGPYKKQPVSEMRTGFELTPWLMNLQDDAYLLNSDDKFNPKASPTLMDLKTFPKTVFISAGNADFLYHEGKDFIEKLNKDGHPDAVKSTMEGEGHGFDKVVNNEVTQKNVKEFQDQMMEAIKRGWKNQIGSS